MGTTPDWNEARKLINALKKNGFTEQAKMVSGLVRVAASVEKGDFAEAGARLYSDIPQKVIRGDGNQ